MGETRREASIGCIARSCLRNKIKQLQKQNKTSTGFLPLLVLFDDDQDVSARAGCKKPSLPKWGGSFRLLTYITMGLMLFFCSLPFPRKSTRKMQRSPCRITRLSWTLPKCKESGRTRRTSALWVSIPLRPSPLMGAGQQAKGWLWGHTHLASREGRGVCEPSLGSLCVLIPNEHQSLSCSTGDFLSLNANYCCHLLLLMCPFPTKPKQEILWIFYMFYVFKN